MITRLGGSDRYSTAAIISSTMLKTSRTAILVAGQDPIDSQDVNYYYDALVTVPLAVAYDAPLLLVSKDNIVDYTETELKRLKVQNLIVVNTNNAISSTVKTKLSNLKCNITYIESNTCFETAVKVANALQSKIDEYFNTLFFITNNSFADALSISPVAAIKSSPILYLNNTGAMNSATYNYLKSVKGKIKNAYIIGGTAVISNAMMNDVASILGLTVNSTVIRIFGANRYETCVAIDNKFKSTLTSDDICVATGLYFADALTGGVYAAKTKQAVLLADLSKGSTTLLDCQSTYLKSKKPSNITVFGDTGAVPTSLVNLIQQASK